MVDFLMSHTMDSLRRLEVNTGLIVSLCFLLLLPGLDFLVCSKTICVGF